MEALLEVWSADSLAGLSPMGKLLWKAVERNTRIFEKGKVANSKLPESSLSLMFSWSYHLPEFKGVKFHDFVFYWDRLIFS